MIPTPLLVCVAENDHLTARALIAACDEILKEGVAGGGTEPLTKQLVDLRGHRGGDEAAAPLCAEKFEDFVSPRLVRVSQRHQRRRVDDERHAPNPSSSSSSEISEIERGSSSHRAKPDASAKSPSPVAPGTYAVIASWMISA